MKITVFGAGYVGLVSGACLAEVGHDVMIVDIDPDRIAMLERGEMPIYEPGLADIIQAAVADQKIHFTTDVPAAVAHGRAIFIAVGTPPDEDGSADCQYVLAVAKTIGELMADEKLVIDKSTVPVGTADRVHATIAEALAERQVDLPFAVASNPEFLKEGSAIADFQHPDRIVIGCQDDQSKALLHEIYAPFNAVTKIVAMDVRSAELTKYAANAMLATKISFMNEMSQIAERVGADIQQVRTGIGSDSRIGFSFINPGCGYGGSCFPKDVRALHALAKTVDYRPAILEAVQSVNETQKQALFTKIEQYFKGDVSGKTLAIWGLAFKPETDDIREAPACVLIDALLAAGAKIQAFDPEAMSNIATRYADTTDLQLCEDPWQALSGADALALVTEWDEFKNADLQQITQALNHPVLFDGRHVYEPQDCAATGLTHIVVGRAQG